MKRCLIVGAGGGGVEVLSWALQMKQDSWEIAGFLDIDPKALDGYNLPYRVLGVPETWTPDENEVFIAAHGNPGLRMRVCGDLQSRGAKFISVIHPSVIMALNVEIGEGCMIAPNVVFGPHAKLGRFVFVNIAATIGHNSVTGEGTTISAHCDVTGHVSIGRECFLGSHACILPGKRVGDFSVVGAGSAVVRNVESGSTVMGVPADVLFRDSKGN
jgi:sugar O-acyltransferase (sialic acid O-acetyltransferase NeuD family)